LVDEPDVSNVTYKDNMNIDEYDGNGRTQLMNAAMVGDCDQVKHLLELGADPNILDQNWGTSRAEHYARKKSTSSEVHRVISKLLIEAELNAKINSGDSPEYKASIIDDEEGFFASLSLTAWFYLLGSISFILSPLTGVTIVAAVFIITAWIIEEQ
jgi:hypothetical protein